MTVFTFGGAVPSETVPACLIVLSTFGPESPSSVPFGRAHPVPKARYGALTHQFIEESVIECEAGCGEICRNSIGRQ